MASDADTLPASDARASTTATHHGRYQVRGILGAGGMGIVLDAVDPILDRAVALKLLHPEVSRGSAGKEAADRLTGEARAMAKVSHPNVVTVYEVGWSGDQIFLAMERIDGVSLRAWLALSETRTRPFRPLRSWRDVTSMFIAAGRGLAAAHRAGLVHRDFKPDNVLIGKDGRPRVADFGLVTTRAVDTDTERDEITGTPAYMAPEQWTHSELGPATDQFAFCVALWEGLSGERPIVGTTPAELRASACERERPPLRAAVPAWLEAALRRGLAADPAERWPTLDALLDRLERGLRRRGRLFAAVAIAGISASLVTALLLWSVSGDRDVCPRPDARVTELFGSRRVSALVAHAAAHGAAVLAGRVSEHIDTELATWAGVHQGTCRATRVAGTQSDSLLDARMHCLEAWAAELDDTLALALRVVAPDELEHALDAVFELPPLARCSDADTLARALAVVAPTGTRGEIVALESTLRGVEIDRRAERFTGLLDRARSVVIAAQAIGYAPLEVAALDTKSRIELGVDQYGDAVQTLRALIQRAAAARDDRSETTAWHGLIYALGYQLGEVDAALALEPAASAALARAGSPLELEVAHELAIAKVLDRGPRAPEGIQRLLAARTRLAQARDAPDAASLANLDIDLVAELANAYAVVGDGAASVAAQREALDGYRELRGPGTLDESMALTNLGDSLRRQGRFAEALDVLREAAVIVEAKTGASARLALNLIQLSYVLGELDRWPEALREAERSVALARATLGPDDPVLATYLSGYASALQNTNKRDEAIAQFDASIALYERVAKDVNLPITLFNRGELFFDLQKLADSERDYRRAIELFEALRPGTAMQLYPLVGLGRTLVAQRRHAEARTTLERALAIEPDGADRGMAAAARAWLGRALVTGRLDRVRGARLETAAIAELATLAPTDPVARREHTLLSAR